MNYYQLAYTVNSVTIHGNRGLNTVFKPIQYTNMLLSSKNKQYKRYITKNQNHKLAKTYK
jgi:hypothetical protein